MAVSPLKPNRIADNTFLFSTNRESGITAHSGGTQAAAYKLGAQRNNVDTVAAAGDSVALPKIVASPGRLDAQGASTGAIVFVFNGGANSMQLYAGTGALDTINAIATATGIAIPPGSGAICVAGGLNSSNVGNWQAYTSFSGTDMGSIVVDAITGGDSSLGITGQAAAQGGAIVVTGGASSTSANAGGAVSLVGGAPGLTGVGGAVSITSGAGGATSGAAGAITIAVGAATSGNGSAITITGGNGAGGTSSGGNINLVPGTAVSTGTPGEVQINGVSGFFEATWQQYLGASVPVTGTSYNFFMANRAYRVKAASIICSSTSTVPTVDITHDTGTNAPGAGTSVLTGVMTMSATANTRVVGTLSATVATLTLAAGDRLAHKWGGTVGSITGALVSVLLEPA